MPKSPDGAGEAPINLSLWLDKFLRWELKEDRRTGEEKWALAEGHRMMLFKQVAKRWQPAAGGEAAARLEEIAASPGHVGFRARTRGRLLVGYGRASSSEASLALHPLWGVPRIPGSALKGVASRQAGEGRELAEGFGREPSRSAAATAGHLVFYDALPVAGQFELAPDVLTPHHPRYYGGQASFAEEWDSPRPHTFLTVVRTTFLFVIGVRGEVADGGGLLQRGVDWLKEALQHEGVGAKTSAGYGRFEVPR